MCYSDPEPDDVAGRDYDSQGRVDIPLLKQLLPFVAATTHLKLAPRTKSRENGRRRGGLRRWGSTNPN